MSKLVLIDGNAILHRAFHALPPLTTRRGEPINAVYGLVSMLLRVVDDLKPTHIIVCFDEKAKTFRQKVFKQYQAHRPAMADELSGQFNKAKDFLKSARIPIYSKKGFEADDVIGTIASEAISLWSTVYGKNGKKNAVDSSRSIVDSVVIITGDRDILQLVNEKVKVYMPVSGLSSGKLMGETEVIEKMGVAPLQIPDYKALVGDPSDNYPGVFGIGPKTATSLLQRYRTVKQIYKDIDAIALAVRQKLRMYKKNAYLSLKLATIVKDVPIKFDLGESSKWDLDNQKVLDLFSQFGFKTLLERVKKVGRELDSQKQEKLF